MKISSTIQKILIDIFVTGGVTAFATYIGAKLGSRKTTELYTEQERVKIREELRRNFYSEYEERYIKIIYDLNEFRLKMSDLQDTIYEELSGKNFLEDVEDVIVFNESSNMISVSKMSDRLYYDIQKLDDFMKSKSIISGYKKEYYSLEIEGLLMIACTFDLLQGIAYSCKKYKKQEIYSTDKENELINEYLNFLIELAGERYDELLNLYNNIRINHERLEDEFIGCYFKE